MKVNAYTIEWKETIHPYEERPYVSRRVKCIAAFDNYNAARARAIEILKARVGEYSHSHTETHSIDRNGLTCDHLRAQKGRYWYQVTIKYHASKRVSTTFW